MFATPHRTAVPFRFSNRSRAGVVATEFAICLPILLLFLFGCYEISKAYMMQHAAESAAYEAARTGVVPNATAQACRDSAARVLRSVGVRNFNLQVSPDPILQDSRTLTISIDVPLERNTLIAPFFMRRAVLHGSCTLQRESF